MSTQSLNSQKKPESINRLCPLAKFPLAEELNQGCAFTESFLVKLSDTRSN